MGQRQLAAIMFTDLVGYSALTQRNEALALELLEKHWELLRPVFARFDGREIKTIGDAFLIEFPSALRSVEAGLAMQKMLVDHNGSVDEDHQIRVRIGIHLDDVERRENDVFGDGVNIAARIEPLASAGGICISEAVYDSIHNKVDVPFYTLGEKKLKNISQPVEVYSTHPDKKSTKIKSSKHPVFVGSILAAILVIVILIAFDRSREEISTVATTDTTTSDKEAIGTPLGLSHKSIAVLPFVDMSPDGDQEYFADGLSEELLNELARLKGLLVTGRTSSFYFKGKNIDLREIGKTLNVDHVLEGSVRKSESQLRITAQLIDTSSGYHIWSETYDRSLDDIFDIQDEIAKSVATALSIKLSVGELGDIEGGTTNVDAYNEVLLGNSLYRKFTPDSVVEAIEHFERAIDLDPNYALAWARLADIYVTAKMVVKGELAENWKTLSGDALSRALELAPTSSAINSTKAFRQSHLGQYREMEHTLNRGAGLSTSTEAKKISGYGILLLHVGRGAEAVELLERARRLNPLSAPTAGYLAYSYAQAGRLDEALIELERGLALGENLFLTTYWGIMHAMASGDRDLVSKWQKRVIENIPEYRPENEKIAELLDDRDGALAWLHTMYDMDEAETPRDFIGAWAAYFGDYELSLNAARREGLPLWLPQFSQVRRLPGYKDLVRKEGLVDYWREFGWSDFCQPLGEDDFECR